VSLEERVRQLAAEVCPVDPAAGEAAQRRSDRQVKPPGSLGQLEAIAARLAAIAGACPSPVPAAPAVVVAAGDHGVHTRGVTPWPQEITARMVEQFCTGGAAVNAIADTVGARVAVLDVGVAGDVAGHPRLRRARVRAGTADLTAGPAMTREEAARALLAGAGLAEELVGSGVDLLVPGDMGIANTTASACLIGVLTDSPAAAVTGRGTGIDDAMLARKTDVVAAALARHRMITGVAGEGPGGATAGDSGDVTRGDPGDDALGTLADVGGLEHAALVGVVLSAAADRVPVVLDGLASVAAGVVAMALCPPVRGYLIAGHRSPEPGATVALEHLGLAPLLDLGLRVGEGTGGLLAVPLVTAAARLLAEMAALDDLDVARHSSGDPPAPSARADVCR
jgi:nicotinate-nucleotide--dimethylbenzimidazole phosphoribosyltransferase